MTDSVERLHRAIKATRAGKLPSPRTAKLFARGRGFIAKKVAEEAVEVALDAVVGDVDGTVRESADLLYNLVALWVDLGIAPQDVWAEMERREALLGMAEKLPKKRSRLPPPALAAMSAGARGLQLPLRLGDSLAHSGYPLRSDLAAPAGEPGDAAATAGAETGSAPLEPDLPVLRG